MKHDLHHVFSCYTTVCVKIEYAEVTLRDYLGRFCEVLVDRFRNTVETSAESLALKVVEYDPDNGL